MKELERQQYIGCKVDVTCGNLTCSECRKIQTAIWRAALEWVLTQKIQSTEELLIDEAAIRKELEDEG